MGLIGFYNWIFQHWFGIALPYGWGWTLSQVTLIVVFAVVAIMPVAGAMAEAIE